MSSSEVKFLQLLDNFKILQKECAELETEAEQQESIIRRNEQKLKVLRRQYDDVSAELQAESKTKAAKEQTEHLLTEELAVLTKEKDGQYLLLVNAEATIKRLSEQKRVQQQEMDAAVEQVLDDYLRQRTSLRDTLFSSNTTGEAAVALAGEQ